MRKLDLLELVVILRRLGAVYKFLHMTGGNKKKAFYVFRSFVISAKIQFFQAWQSSWMNDT